MKRARLQIVKPVNYEVQIPKENPITAMLLLEYCAENPDYKNIHYINHHNDDHIKVRAEASEQWFKRCVTYINLNVE